jgi:hypothetical protein
MADRESTAVGYRLRGFGPTDLSTYPDRTKLMFWQWVVDLGLARKDLELSRGWDKDGAVHPLRPTTIKYRRSQMGPVHKRAPRLTPALDLSRVRSLLTGRAHATSAEFWWKFDSVTGASFAAILHYQADEYGHDVFGLSPQGTAWVTSEAMKKWNAWKAAGGALRAVAEVPGARVSRKPEFLNPIRKRDAMGVKNLKDMDIAGDREQVKRAIAEEWSPGFRRLNTSFEQWTPGTGLGRGPTPPRPPRPPRQPVKPAPGPINLPVTRFIPAAPVVPIVSREQIDALVKTAAAAHVSTVPVGLLRVQSDRIGALQDLVNKRIVQWYRDHPSSEPIVVIFEQGKFFIHEGHHRSAAAAMRGGFALPGLIFRRRPGTRAEAELLVMDANGNLHPVKP